MSMWLSLNFTPIMLRMNFLDIGSSRHLASILRPYFRPPRQPSHFPSIAKYPMAEGFPSLHQQDWSYNTHRRGRLAHSRALAQPVRCIRTVAQQLCFPKVVVELRH